MDFEKLYQKYKNGTATDEEIKLVEEEIKKAKEISNILEESPDESPKADVEKIQTASNPFDREKFKEALQYFNFRQFIKTIIITVSVVVIVSLLAVGTIFGIAFYSANQSNNITKEKAIENAKTYIADYTNTTPDKLIVSDRVDKDLELRLNLTKSLYVYEIELTTPVGEYTVEVNATSGYVHITDVDGGNSYPGRHNGHKD